MMTDEQIVKGWECCHKYGERCSECPYKTVNLCIDTLHNDIFGIMQWQKDEIERLTEQLKTARADAVRELEDRVAALVKEKVAIIDELFRDCGDDDISIAYYRGKVELLQNLGWCIKEIVREMMEGRK